MKTDFALASGKNYARSAKGSDIDIVMASAKAYVNALNRHLFIAKEAKKA